MKEAVDTLLADRLVEPLPWQLELRRLSDQLAASDYQKLTKDELQREVRDLPLDSADRNPRS